uniref:C-type lectin domain-containing protein n=1 Tax=Lates calcarifer TaxID=8187 RepID=A0A4W6CDS6_LATCA
VLFLFIITYISLLFIRCLLTMTNVSLPAGLCSCLKHYYLIDEPKTWHEALDYCKEKYNNLAIVNNDVNRLVNTAQYSTGGFTERAWIGLHDNLTSWRWSFSDSGYYGDKEADYRNWGFDQPDNFLGEQMCVEMWDLVSIRNEEENREIQLLAKNRIVWIGLYRYGNMVFICR